MILSTASIIIYDCSCYQTKNIQTKRTTFIVQFCRKDGATRFQHTQHWRWQPLLTVLDTNEFRARITKIHVDRTFVAVQMRPIVCNLPKS